MTCCHDRPANRLRGESADNGGFLGEARCSTRFHPGLLRSRIYGKNLRFTLTLEPNNRELKSKHEWAQKMRAEGKYTIPSTIGDDKQFNPFLRTGQ